MNKKGTFTSKELCERYGCVLRTIHAKEQKLGFPHGTPFGKELVFPAAKVIAWERIHMPYLHGVEPAHDDSKTWADMMSGKLTSEDERKRKKRPPRRKR